MISFAPAIMLGVTAFPLELISGKDKTLWTGFVSSQGIFIIITLVAYFANFTHQFVIKKWHIKMKAERGYPGIIEQIKNMVLPAAIILGVHFIIVPVIFATKIGGENAVLVYHTSLLLIFVGLRLAYGYKNDKNLGYYYN